MLPPRGAILSCHHVIQSGRMLLKGRQIRCLFHPTTPDPEFGSVTGVKDSVVAAHKNVALPRSTDKLPLLFFAGILSASKTGPLPPSFRLDLVGRGGGFGLIRGHVLTMSTVARGNTAMRLILIYPSCEYAHKGREGFPNPRFFVDIRGPRKRPKRVGIGKSGFDSSSYAEMHEEHDRHLIFDE